MDYTANYQLPQWVDSDRILRTDFNSAYQKLDAALKTNADGLAAETAARTAKDAEHAAFGAERCCGRWCRRPVSAPLP